MKLEGDGILLRIFLGEQDQVGHVPLYEEIVRKAREAGIAGSTVLRGVMGYGAASRVIHTAKILRLSEDLPFVVEIVDTEARIAAFLPTVRKMFEDVGCGGMITTERVHVLTYTAGA